MQAEDIDSLKYSALQRIAKDVGIRANMKVNLSPRPNLGLLKVWSWQSLHVILKSHAQQ